jgi:spermidine synthase
VVWSRILAVFTLNAVFSFSIMLSTFLFGLTLGGWLGARWLRTHKASWTIFGRLQLAIGLAALVTLYVFWLLPNRVTLETVFGAYTVSNLILYELLLGVLTLLPPATLFGLLFPVAVSLYTVERTDQLGRRIGLLNAFNTLGAVLGSLVIGFILIPLIGLQTTTITLGRWSDPPAANAGLSRLGRLRSLPRWRCSCRRVIIWASGRTRPTT